VSLVQRLINVKFQLANGTFVESGTDTVELSGLRITCDIVKAGGPSMGTLEMQIYGMTLSLMNQLSTLGIKVTLVPRNVVTVTAGDGESGMGTVFVGNITEAWTIFPEDGSPNVSFHVAAHVLGAFSVAPAQPSSFTGSTDVATILNGLATQMALAFENNGVNVKLNSPYFYGSPRDQALACVNAAAISWNGGDNGTLAIWPRGGSRGGLIPLLSKTTGMIGYPSYTAQGISVRSVFNPSIGFGSQIQVQSDFVKAANGMWAVYALNYELDSLMPNGRWRSFMQCYNSAFPSPVAS